MLDGDFVVAGRRWRRFQRDSRRRSENAEEVVVITKVKMKLRKEVDREVEGPQAPRLRHFF
jgi:hypothetical protein